MMYIRNYQSIVRAPILRQIMDQTQKLASFYIERQDKGIVETHMPKRSELRMGEKLIQGDGPIIAYRRRRDELLHQKDTIPLQK
jgi:hypothetical protein